MLRVSTHWTEALIAVQAGFTTSIVEFYTDNNELSLGGNSFFVVSTIPVFDSSRTNVRPVMINPGLHFWNVAGLPDVVEQQGPPSTTSIPLILLFQGC